MNTTTAVFNAYVTVRKSDSGRQRTVCTRDNIDDVELLVVSQEDAPGTHRTIGQVARETSIPKTLVHRIIQKDLKLQCFKKKRAKKLTEANKIKHLVCAEHAVSCIWFTDEKQFTVQPKVNLQNDGCVCPTWKPEESGISRAPPAYAVHFLKICHGIGRGVDT